MRAKIRSRFVAIASICCALVVSTWLGVQLWPSHAPQDYEACSEKRRATAASSKDERASLIAECDKQFIGRRKPGGGYAYYDFLQNRRFDIAGPNPTPKELKSFDEEYIVFLQCPAARCHYGSPCREAKAEGGGGFSKRSVFSGHGNPTGGAAGDYSQQCDPDPRNWHARPHAQKPSGATMHPYRAAGPNFPQE